MCKIKKQPQTLLYPLENLAVYFGNGKTVDLGPFWLPALFINFYNKFDLPSFKCNKNLTFERKSERVLPRTFMGV